MSDRPAGGLRQVVGETAIYGLSQAISRAMVFLLVPIYARSLAPGDFGAAALIAALATLGSIVVTLGFDFTLTRWYWLTEDPDDRRTTVATVFWAQLFASLSLAGAAALVAPLAARVLVGDERLTDEFRLAAAGLVPLSLAAVLRVWLRTQRRPLTALALNIALAAVTLALAILFVPVLELGVSGIFLATGSASAVGAAAAVALMRSWADPRRIRKDRFRAMLSLGAPTVPGNGAVWFVDLSDRFMIRLFESAAQVGRYQVAATLAAATSLGVAALEQAWGPYALSIQDRPGAREIYARVLLATVSVLGAVAVAVSAAAPLVFGVVASDTYEAAPMVMSLLAFAFVLVGVRVVLNTAGLIVGSQRGVTAALIAGALLNLLLNLAFVPIWGIAGAGLATLVAQLAAAVMTYVASRGLLDIPFQPVLAGTVFTVMLVLGLVAASLSGEVTGTLVSAACVGLALAIAGVIVFTPGGFASRIVRPGARSGKMPLVGDDR